MTDTVDEKTQIEGGSVDAILKRLGRLGRFQLFQGFMLSLCNIPVCFHLLNTVFIAQLMDHECKSPVVSSNDSSHSGGNVVAGTCEVTSFNFTTNATVSEKCTSWTYLRSKDLSLTSEWDLVCENAVFARLPQSLFIVGQGIGAVVFATVSDKYGRKPTLLISLVLTTGAGVSMAFAPSITAYTILRLLNGVFQQGIVVTLSTAMMEPFIASQRVAVSAYSDLIWSLYTVMLTFVAYLLRYTPWRTSQLVFTSFSLVFVLHFVFLEESLRWLVINQKEKQVIKMIGKAAKMNKVDVSDLNLEQVMKKGTSELRKTSDQSKATTRETHDKEHSYKYTCLDIFRNKFVLRLSLVMWFSWFVDSLTYFSLYLTSSSLADDLYLNFFLNSLAEVPAGPLYLIVAKRYGRRKFFMSMHVLAGVCLLLATGLRAVTDNNATYIAATTLAGQWGRINNLCELVQAKYKQSKLDLGKAMPTSFYFRK